MGEAIMAILAGVCLIGMVIYPMGKSPLRENEVAGWAAWRKEFAFSLKFYNPLVIFYEWGMGWDRIDEMLCRFIFAMAGIFALLAGAGFIILGFFLWGQA